MANPQGGRVTAGSASLHQASRSRLDVNQRSDRAVIDWRTFNIDQNEHTNFRQPSKSAIALNRVQGGDLSTIDGRLSANGQVYLVNQNGILFGNNAQVDVAGLVATTADISNEDFMNGIHRFSKSSENSAAQVVNKGQIRVQEGGAVVLAAPRVSNEGLIDARLGKVALAGVETFTLDLNGDGLLQYDVGSEVSKKPSAVTTVSDALVSNAGTIVADGGVVSMSARAADGVVDRVINMTGVVQARAVEVSGGTIILSGGDEGIVAVSGELDASGPEMGQKGGTVKVLGEKVGLFEGAKIDASGDAGGGEVLIGGNYKGQGPEPNAKQTFVAKGASIKADANARGDGGKVIVWADEAASIHGTLSARGGAISGNGGFIETSSKNMLTVSSAPDASAPNGSGGTWLIDPTDIFICAGVGCDITISSVRIPNNTINDALNTGTSVILNTDSDDNELGNITQEPGAAISKTGGTDATLTLQAHNNINLNDDITSTSGSLNLVLQADFDNNGVGGLGIGNIPQRTSINTNGGDFTGFGRGLSDGIFGIIVSNTDINAGGGDISLTGIGTPGAFSRGIVFRGNPVVETTGAGTINLQGTSIGGTDSTHGILIEDAGGRISAVDGDVRLTGTASGSGSGNIGIELNNSVVETTGAGEIGLAGTGGTGTTGNDGIVISGSTPIQTNGGGFSVVGDTLLGSDSSISTGGGGITFGLIDSGVGAQLTLDAGGGAIALGDVGSTSPLGGLTATGGTISLQDVTTQGAQTYTGALTLNSSYNTGGFGFSVNGDTLLGSDSSVTTGGGGITFGLIDSAVGVGAPLTLDAGGGAIALGDVGIGTNTSFLGGLTATGGSISLQDVTTQGAQTYTGALTLNSSYNTGGFGFSVNGNTLLRSDSSVSTLRGGITFNGLIDSAVAGGGPAVLTLNAGVGAIALLGNVGSSPSPLGPLGGLTATGGSIGLQDVTTTGDQRYTGAVTLNSNYITNGSDFSVIGNTLLGSDSSVSTGGGGITFNGLIDSAVFRGDPAELTLNAGGVRGGAIALLGNVGSRSLLGGLTATGGSIGLQDVTTQGEQAYTSAGAVTLNSSYSTNGGNFSVIGDTLLGSDSSVSTGGGGITFGLIDLAVAGGRPAVLTLDAGQGAIALGNVGSRSPLGELTATGGNISLRNVTTQGAQTYRGTGTVTLNNSYITNGFGFLVDGNTFLGSDSSVSTGGGGITFNGLIDSAVGVGAPPVLTLNAVDGAIALGNVGSNSPLGGLTATGDSIGLQNVTTTGAQSYTGAVTLLGSNSSVSTGGGGITFNDLIDSAAGAPLTLNAVDGAIALLGDVGSISPLGGLDATGGSIGLQNVTTTGDQSYTGAVTLNSSYITNGGNFAVTGDSVIVSTTSASTNGGDVLFNGSLNGGNALNLSAGAGDIVFAGDVGTSRRLGAITIDSARDITINGRFVGGATRFNYGGVATSAEDSLDLASLFLSPSAAGATLFGTVNRSSGDDAAVAVQGPVNDRDFTINGCVIGVPCGVVLAPAAQPVPFRKGLKDLSTAPSSPKVRALVTVYKRRPPSEDPTEPQYSNFGNEELWD